MFGFIFTIFITPVLNNINIELPLIGVQGVVERNNKLYIGIGPYRRIQIYDINGNYIGFRKVENVSQNFYFKIDDNDNIQTEINEISNVVPSKYLCKGSVTYFIEKKIPLKMKCYLNYKTIYIEQSLFKYLWFPPILWIISAVGFILFFFINIK